MFGLMLVFCTLRPFVNIQFILMLSRRSLDTNVGEMLLASFFFLWLFVLET